MKNFLLIDDHAVVRSGLSYLINEFYKPCMIDEAENEAQAIEKIRSNSYSLIFLDINIPNISAIDLLRFILISKPEAKVLIFSMNAEKLHAKRYLHAGAMGYLSKDTQIDEIKRAISQVLNNKKYYSENLIDSLLSQKDSLHNNNHNPFEKLTDREFEIMHLFLSGKSLTEISSLLNIQRSTTGTHKTKIYEKLNVKNMVELIELATIHNIISS